MPYSRGNKVFILPGLIPINLCPHWWVSRQLVFLYFKCDLLSKDVVYIGCKWMWLKTWFIINPICVSRTAAASLDTSQPSSQFADPKFDRDVLHCNLLKWNLSSCTWLWPVPVYSAILKFLLKYLWYLICGRIFEFCHLLYSVSVYCLSPSLHCCVHPSWFCVPLFYVSLKIPTIWIFAPAQLLFLRSSFIGFLGSLASFTSDKKQYIQSQFNWIVLAYLTYMDHLADFLREFAVTPHQIPFSLALPLLPPASHKRSRPAGALPAAGAGSMVPNVVHLPMRESAFPDSTEQVVPPMML